MLMCKYNEREASLINKCDIDFRYIGRRNDVQIPSRNRPAFNRYKMADISSERRWAVSCDRMRDINEITTIQDDSPFCTIMSVDFLQERESKGLNNRTENR